MNVNQRVREIGRRQRGFVTRRQLLQRAGVSASTIRRRVRSGDWIEALPNVIDLGTHPPTWTRSVQRLVLAAGPEAWVSHWSAAVLHGFLDVARPTRHDILVPRGSTDVIQGMQLHSTQSIGADEVTHIDGLPCTSRARTLIDIAGSASVDEIERFALDLCRKDPSFAAQLTELLDRYRRRSGRARVLAAMKRLPEGVRKLGSPLEIRGVQALTSAAVPAGVLQHVVHDDDGRYVKRVDIAWPEARVIVEFDGAAYHDLLHNRERDSQVRSRLRALGWDVFVIRAEDLAGPTWNSITHQLHRRLS